MVGAAERPDFVVVGGTDDDIALLHEALPELDDFADRPLPVDSPPVAPEGTTGCIAVVFEAESDPARVNAWLDVLPHDFTILVGRDRHIVAPAGVEVIPAEHRVRLVPAIARLVRNMRVSEDPTQPGAVYCERLLRTADPDEICQIIAESAVTATGADWTAILRVSGEGRALEVGGSVGQIPSLLRDYHDMTPAELAGLLGWNAQSPFAQVVPEHTSTVSRALTREGTSVAFAIIHGARTLQGIVISGWSSSTPIAHDRCARLTTLTELGAAALRYAVLVADLRISDRTKSEFVATMSHELRNPLSAILGYTDLLVHGDFGQVSEEQTQVLRRAHESASSLLDLINATLDVSRIEVGSGAEQDSQVEVITLAKEEADELSRGRLRAQVRLEGDEQVPATVFGHPLKIRVTLRQAMMAALAANRGEALRLSVERRQDGCEVEIAPESIGSVDGLTPLTVEPPDTADAEDVPFAVFIAKRLLQLIGATLVVSRESGGDRTLFQIWIPDGPPNTALL